MSNNNNNRNTSWGTWLLAGAGAAVAAGAAYAVANHARRDGDFNFSRTVETARNLFQDEERPRQPIRPTERTIYQEPISQRSTQPRSIFHEPMSSSSSQLRSSIDDAASTLHEPNVNSSNLTHGYETNIKNRKVFFVTNETECRNALDEMIWDLARYGVVGFNFDVRPGHWRLLQFATENYCVIIQLLNDMSDMPRELKTLLSNSAIIKVGFDPMVNKNLLPTSLSPLSSTLDLRNVAEHNGIVFNEDRNYLNMKQIMAKRNAKTFISTHDVTVAAIQAIDAFNVFKHFHETLGENEVNGKKTILYRQYLNQRYKR